MLLEELKAETYMQGLMLNHVRVLVTGFYAMVFFSIHHPRAYAHTELGPPTSVTKKMPYRLAFSPSIRRQFLSWGCLFPEDSSVCQIDIKLVGTRA